MKEISGYLIDRNLGTGISGKAVIFRNLANAVITPTYGSKYEDAATDADGFFRAWYELSPGPVNVQVTVSGSEKKVRKHNEKAQMGIQWSSDISRIGRAMGNGVIGKFLNELNVSTSGHNIIIATGGAVIDGVLFSIENGSITVAGSANTTLPTRKDILTLRQYKETASGQNAGRQDIILTTGVTDGVAPAIPTGSDFTDLLIATLTTAQNASTKTVTDNRPFVSPSSDATKGGPLYFEQLIPGTLNKTNAAQFTAGTLTMSGLDPNLIYDGYIDLDIAINASGPAAAWNSQLNMQTPNKSWIRPSNAWVVLYEINQYSTANPVTDRIQYRIPVIGLTGVSSETFALSLRFLSDGASAGSVYSALLEIGPNATHLAVLQPVIKAVLTPRR